MYFAFKEEFMDNDDLNYFMRHGEMPSKESESKLEDKSVSEEPDNEYYSYSDYEMSKSEKIWSHPETKLPFWLSTIFMLILAFFDLLNQVSFDIEYIFAISILWVITFAGLLLLFTFFRWLKNKL